MAVAGKKQGALERWARFAHRRRGRVIASWFAILVVLIAAMVTWGGKYQSEFTIPGSEVQTAADLLKERFPARSGDTSDIVIEASAGVTVPATKTKMESLFSTVAVLPGVSAIESPYENPGYIAQDGKIARAVVRWNVQAHDVASGAFSSYLKAVDAANGDGVTVETGGLVVQQNEQPEFGSEGLGILAAVVILMIAFGSAIAVGLPIGAAIFGLGAGFSLIALGANFMSFPVFSPQFAAMIGLGVGIDYSLLVVTRFREGLHHGRSVEDSVVLAVTTAGRSVLFAGIVVSIAFLGLYSMGLPFVAALGTAGAIVVVVSVAVALTLMPSFLSLAGHNIDRWRIPFFHSSEGVDPKSGWYRLSVAIQAHPVRYFVVAAVVLLSLAAPALTLKLGFTDAGNSPTDLHSRRAYDLLKKGFGAGFNGPLIVVTDLTKGGSKEVLDRTVEAIRQDANVAAVSPAALNPAGDTEIVTAFPKTSPQDSATQQLVHKFREQILPGAMGSSGARSYVTGATAGNGDAGDRIQERMPLLFGGVIGLSFILLMTVFRSVLVALKAAIMNLLSIGAAYGVVVMIFQHGFLGDLLGIQKGPIETFLPMMLFAILFGLSMDYEVFLISRVREEYVRTRENATAVSHGLAATARVITAAAAIMVAVFLTFVLGPDRVIKEFGIGLATAIFVDATVVRLFLVPATMELLGERNWWMPAWLDRILPNINVDGDALPAGTLEPEPAFGGE